MHPLPFTCLAVTSQATLSEQPPHLFYLCDPDQRVRGWLLLDDYPPTFALTVVYLLIVWMGPKYMKNRQPYSCRGLLVLYNLGLTLLSFYMFYEVNRLLSTERCAEMGQSITAKSHCRQTAKDKSGS